MRTVALFLAFGGVACHQDVGTEDHDAASGGEPHSVIQRDNMGGYGGTIVPPDLIWPSDCDAHFQYRCDDYTPLAGCLCDDTIPDTVEECGGYGRLYCEQWVDVPGTFGWVDCTCNPTAPGSAHDCEATADYTCDHRLDTEDNRGEQCRCEPERPDKPEDCPAPEMFFCDIYAPHFEECWCDVDAVFPVENCWSSAAYGCASTDPVYGCDCASPR